MPVINRLHRTVVDSQEKAEEWLSGFSKSYDTALKGKPILIGIGGAGSNFINRCIDDGFHRELPTVYVTRDPKMFIRSKAVHNIFIEKEKSKGIEQLAPLLDRLLSIHFDTVYIVCGLGGSSAAYAHKAAELAKKKKMKSIIAGYIPFHYEKMKLEQAQSGRPQLRNSEYCDQFFEVDNSDVLEFVSPKALIADVCALIDEPIREHIDFLAGEPGADKPYDPVELYLHTEEINAIVDDLKSAL